MQHHATPVMPLSRDHERCFRTGRVKGSLYTDTKEELALPSAGIKMFKERPHKM